MNQTQFYQQRIHPGSDSKIAAEEHHGKETPQINIYKEHTFHHRAMNHNFFSFSKNPNHRGAWKKRLSLFSHSHRSSYIIIYFWRCWCSMSLEKRQQVKPLSTGGRQFGCAPREAACGVRCASGPRKERPTWERGALVRKTKVTGPGVQVDIWRSCALCARSR